MPSREIRQGDPLSPYLFIICMEVLTRDLRKAQNTKECGIGFKISPRVNKIHLFADDSLLFYRSNLESCQRLNSLLVKFCRNSWQIINFHKSSITFSKNVTAYDKQVVSSIFDITHQDILRKYLGCLVFRGRPKLETFSELVNKTASNLQSWTSSNILKAGCVALVQTNAKSIPAHTMQYFQLPCTTSR